MTLPLRQPGDQRIPPGRLISLPGDPTPIDVIAPSSGGNSIWVRTDPKTAAWRVVELPATLAADPLPWGRDLLIPGADGRVYLIDPVTMQSKAEPLVPVFDRDRRGRWRAPVLLDPNSVILADDTGRVRRLSIKKEPVPRLTIDAETSLDKGLSAEIACTPSAVILATTDQKIRALSARDLSPVGTWPLDAPLSGQPVSMSKRCFVYDNGGGVMAFGEDGRRQWAIKLDAPAVGSPAIDKETVWLLDREGRLHGRSLADGAPRQRVDLGIFPAGGLLTVGSQSFAPVARGSLQAIELESKFDRKP